MSSELSNTEGVFNKLITAEDGYHVHKFFGVFCLLNFVVRFFYIGAADMGFGPDMISLLCIGMHLFLSLSSLIFHIPKKRIKEGSRIWPEYRLHSIIFACRSVACMLIVWAEKLYKLEPNYYFNVAVIFATMLVADFASYSVQDHSSTIRDLSAGAATRYTFSVMQFHATLGCLMGIRRFSTQFAYIFIIQFTAFLMTLRRKNLAGHLFFVSTYGLLLAVVFLIAMSDLESITFGIFVNTMANSSALMRVGFGLDKYTVWTIMAIVVNVTRSHVYDIGFEAWVAMQGLSIVALVIIGYGKVNREKVVKD